MKNKDDELDYNIVFNDEIYYDSFNEDDEDDDCEGEDCEDRCSCHHHEKNIDECEDEDCGCCNHANKNECSGGESGEHFCDCDNMGHKDSNLNIRNETKNNLGNDSLTQEEFERKRKLKLKLSKYKDFQFDDETDFTCELDPTKQCDNCGKCLEIINTDEKGYAKIDIDKIDKSNVSIEQLYKMYGLDDD